MPPSRALQRAVCAIALAGVVQPSAHAQLAPPTAEEFQRYNASRELCQDGEESSDWREACRTAARVAYVVSLHPDGAAKREPIHRLSVRIEALSVITDAAYSFLDFDPENRFAADLPPENAAQFCEYWALFREVGEIDFEPDFEAIKATHPDEAPVLRSAYVQAMLTPVVAVRVAEDHCPTLAGGSQVEVGD